MKTIIFLSGMFVPNWLGRSKFLWNQNYWSDYNCIWLTSKIPYSNMMVERELNRLQFLVEKYPDTVLVGQSLGAWWAANLACRPNCNIKKMVLWTPLTDHLKYPIFNASPFYNPCNQTPNFHNTGSSKVLVYYGLDDWIVPHEKHAHDAICHFKAKSYRLKGGHYYQENHQEGLKYMRDWIEMK